MLPLLTAMNFRRSRHSWENTFPIVRGTELMFALPSPNSDFEGTRKGASLSVSISFTSSLSFKLFTSPNGYGKEGGYECALLCKMLDYYEFPPLADAPP